MKNVSFAGELPECLSDYEQDQLILKTLQGDSYARDLLITHNIRLVIYEVMKKFRNTNCEAEDLVSVGILGLIKAVDNYKNDKNTKLTTYATRCIDNEILMYLIKAKKLLKQVSYNSELKYRDEYSMYLDALQKYDAEFIELIEDNNIIEMLKQIIEGLPKKERMVISLKFGLIDGICYSQTEISEKMNISQGYISKIIKRVLGQIRLTSNETLILRKNSMF